MERAVFDLVGASPLSQGGSAPSFEQVLSMLAAHCAPAPDAPRQDPDGSDASADANCPVSGNDRDGTTPLHRAAGDTSRPRDDVALLAERCPQHVEAPNGRGLTPLHCAIEARHWGAAAALLERGADPCALTAAGSSAVHLAALADHAPTLAALLDAAAARGCDIVALPGARGENLLHAATRGVLVLGAVLRHAPGTPALEAPDRHGTTPLGFAASAGALPAAAMLLRAGASPDGCASPGGHTPLRLAARAGHAALVALLLGAGARPDAAAVPDGYTALHLAALNGHAPAACVLLDAGADPALRTSPGAASHAGCTALEVALAAGRRDVAAAIARHAPPAVRVFAEPVCVVCREAQTPCLAAYPCGHRCLCDGCAAEMRSRRALDECPMCRAPALRWDRCDASPAPRPSRPVVGSTPDPCAHQ